MHSNISRIKLEFRCNYYVAVIQLISECVYPT